MKTKLLLSLIACGFMMNGVGAMESNDAQWATKARRIEARDVTNTDVGTQQEVLDHLAYYLDPSYLHGESEVFAYSITHILDAVNAQNPTKELARYWDSRINGLENGFHPSMSGQPGDVAIYKAYNSTITQDIVNNFLENAIAIRDRLEADNPNNPNVTRLNTLIRILVADDIPEFAKAYTPALILLRDRVLQVLSH